MEVEMKYGTKHLETQHFSDIFILYNKPVMEDILQQGSQEIFLLGGFEFFLVKTDGSGNEIWNKTFGGLNATDGGKSVRQTTDGGYIITGKINYSGLGAVGDDIYLIKTDANGNEIWNKTFGGNFGDRGFSVQQTNDSGYIITGYTQTPNENYIDVYLIKTDEQGNITSTFEIPLPNSNRKLKKTIDILGKETKPQPNTPIIEIYDDGTFGEESDNRMKNLILTLIITLPLTLLGTRIQEQTFGGNVYDWGRSGKQTSDGGYIITGSTSSFGNGSNDVWLIKTDSKEILYGVKLLGVCRMILVILFNKQQMEGIL